ncbi:type II secretion system protein [Coraliomargarita sp. SDUM461004]|uniref:Type II secretion system protein n=1 Tax=Thalassobacterium sedimentorum TaxID=3041258 RepID=A0ABU1AFB8_9BACT|nr:type II secretion system protein [Coraliomargarita sp. SDUM461004]MDQ8193357.1 type II secretion system protein [Coraliomargarita sp. SDUM461004]
MRCVRINVFPRKAYTLVELMVSVALLGIVMTSMVATFMVFASGSKGVAAYTEMSRQSRIALELFARDVRAAEDVWVANQDELRVIIPQNAFYNGNSVAYHYDSDIGIFSRVERDQHGVVRSNEILLDGVEGFTFGFFDPLGQALPFDTESLLLSAKSVQIDAALRRVVSRTEATDYIISARFMMRNRAVTE